MENPFGRVSQLNLKTEERDGKTILEDVYFTAPFKVMNPFVKKDGSIQIMMMSASAGIMEGDRQEFHFHIGEGSKMEFLSQSFDKIHKMKEGEARRYTKAVVEKNGHFLFHPQPTIPFKASAYENTMDIYLEDSSAVFTMQEILSCGRAARGERFQYRKYDSLVNIYKNDKLIYRDNTHYRPDEMNLEAIGMYEGYTHMANLVLCNQKKGRDWMDRVWKYLDSREEEAGGVTALDEDVVVIRILGHQAQKLQNICNDLLKLA